MTKGHKHYIISTGRNHEYLLETRLRIFLPATWKVTTNSKPTIKDTFFRKDYNPSKASVQNASSRKSSLPLQHHWGIIWVSSVMSVSLSFDLCLSCLGEEQEGWSTRRAPAGQACGAQGSAWAESRA